MKTKHHHHHHHYHHHKQQQQQQQQQHLRKSLTSYDLRSRSSSRCVSPRTFASSTTAASTAASTSASTAASSSSSSYVRMPLYGRSSDAGGGGCACAVATSRRGSASSSESDSESESESGLGGGGGGGAGAAAGAAGAAGAASGDDGSSECGEYGSDVPTTAGSSAHFGESLWVPVTPQMLMLALKHLSPTGRPQTEEAIADYIMERYPCRTKRFIQQEVGKKLRCACAVGMVNRFGTKKYRMPQHKGCTSHLSTQEIASFWRLCQYDKKENVLVVCRRNPFMPEMVAKLRGHKRWAHSDSTIYLDTEDAKPSKRRKQRHRRHSRR